MMKSKDEKFRLYTELDLKNAYWEGIIDKTSFFAVIAAALLVTSVVATIAGKLVPPILEAAFNPTIPNEVNN
ncbi:MAG: hypothetical protein F6K22_08995 [Okeania sp. SIO2F4]|uniref:hypothetical protein n=1 Tax=Okeania sp. SIO2F4 TaxID=2607790 RepID=UPI0014299F7E|nr:hypothetical protein [Okeania sp. SIO2F4]NES02970.1 hypothetical protein [Okeania sp. SIO2F4]